MRVNNALSNVPDNITTDDGASPQQAGPALAPHSENASNAAPPSEGKRLEGQLDAFLFRNHLEASPSKSPLNLAGSVSSSMVAATKSPSLAGMRLGTNQYGEEVKVTKEVGDPKGYDNRLQAISIARMNGIDPAAVVQSSDGRFHAVQTTANFDTPRQVASDNSMRSVEGLPSSAHIDEVRDEVQAMRTELKQTGDRIRQARSEGTSPSPEDVQRRDKVSAELPQKQKELASLVFGVPESEIQFNKSPQDDVPGKINMDADMPGAAGTEHFDTKNLAGDQAFSVSLDRLMKPHEAAGTLFHELSHAQDAETAHKWLDKFRQEKTGFGNSPDDVKSFLDWLKTRKGGEQLHQYLSQQPASSLSKSDTEVVADAAAHANVSTESRAYVHSINNGAQAGNLAVVADQVKSYAQAVRKGQTMEPFPASATRQALTQELHNMYQHLPDDKAREAFKAEVKKAAAEGGEPNLWITQLDFIK
ncbi:MAG TPA: hypothetical protein VHW45_14635 [Candidatus Sulfotelmatobacter sp.]|jgi:hypothetical protein|nr:hypothetical protein [Candidatus Sulfotelmatobacter sp.]